MSKKIKQQVGCWGGCGKTSDINSKKVHSLVLTTDIIKSITTRAKVSEGNEGGALTTIEDFLHVEARQFVKLLKDLSSVALDQE